MSTDAVSTIRDDGNGTWLASFPEGLLWSTRSEQLGRSDEAAALRAQAELGVPVDLGGCHTSKVEGYIVEGHVSAAVIDRLLSERPNIRGVSLPGMPTGSPGMGGPKREPFRTYAFSADRAPRLYAVE